MKAISLWQPWATFIAIGEKWLETRSWSTSYRGPLLIHAAKRLPEGGAFGDWNVNRLSRSMWRATNPLVSMSLPLGAAVATAELVHVVPMVDDGAARNCLDMRVGHPEVGMALRIDEPLDLDGDGLPIPIRSSERPERIVNVADQLPYGDFAPGRFAWILENVTPLPKPIPMRGRQGLWNAAGADVLSL